MIYFYRCVLLCGLCIVCAVGAAAAAVNTQTRFIIYYNSDASPLEAVASAPYTHVILSFLTARRENGQLQVQAPQRLEPFWSLVPQLQQAGKKVMISFGGGEFQAPQYAALAGHECELAQAIADFVRAHGLDGVDIDYEASDSFFQPLPAGVLDGRRFLIALHQALRQQLPAPRYVISHAPQPPYLYREWHGGPYLDVLAAVGAETDWIAVQYYDNPGFDGPPASRIIGEGETPFATAYRALAGELITVAGQRFTWPANKLVVGKPVYQDDASHGHLSPPLLIDEVLQPLLQIYGPQFGGLMGWQFSTLTSDHQAWNQELGPVLFTPATTAVR